MSSADDRSTAASDESRRSADPAADPAADARDSSDVASERSGSSGDPESSNDAESSAAAGESTPEGAPPWRRRHRSTFREYLEAFLIAVIFATFARTFVVQAFKIPTGSMEQNLLIGDHILVNKFVYGPTATELERLLLPHRDVERGDVVVFKFPEDPSRDFIKRCVALPGDRVEIIGDRLFIDGREVDDASYTYFRPEVRYRPHFGPVTVPRDEYFCMGDNRDNSRDSRAWGGVPESYVKGRAFMIYWSYDGGRQPLEWTGLADKLEQLVDVARGFFVHTRWDRTFTIVR
ncbi:MAG: signal peptidase I [Thermoanaerobaculia bacterium]|nr:signal peptidase I [Thermoanaerobaculia bacterium]